MRGTVFAAQQTFVVETCIRCGIPFALTAEFRDECLREKAGKNFYCPNGHSQCYAGESDKDRAVRMEREMRREQDRADSIERSRRAVKGQLTKTKKRIANGLCPCCNRAFANLHNHMKSQHPDYVNPAGEEEA